MDMKERMKLNAPATKSTYPFQQVRIQDFRYFADRGM